MYLIPSDFKKAIQADLLSQVVGNDDSILLAGELKAIEEATSYLTQKYILDGEFKATDKWDKTRTYYGSDRVFMDAPAFQSEGAYAVGAYVSYGGNIYIANTAVSADSFKIAQWNYLCVQYQIFSAVPPYAAFDVNKLYNTGDQVFYNGDSYTALQPSSPVLHPPSIEYQYYNRVPKPNTFPNGTSGQWGPGIPYFIPANTEIVDELWTLGDNRSQQLVTACVDIALYEVHSRISPRNIPDLRVKRYDDAIKWLKMCAEGKVTAAMPVKQPKAGGRIRWGGKITSNNSY